MTELRLKMGVLSSCVLILSRQWGETTLAYSRSKGSREPSPFPRGARDQDGAQQAHMQLLAYECFFCWFCLFLKAAWPGDPATADLGPDLGFPT